MKVSSQLHAPPTLLLEKNPVTHWKGGWVAPRTGLDNFGEEKIACLSQDLNPEPSTPQDSHYIDYAIPSPNRKTWTGVNTIYLP